MPVFIVFLIFFLKETHLYMFSTSSSLHSDCESIFFVKQAKISIHTPTDFLLLNAPATHLCCGLSCCPIQVVPYQNEQIN